MLHCCKKCVLSCLGLNRTNSSLKKNTEIAVRGALFSIEELTKQIGFQYSKFIDARRDWEINNLASSLPSNALSEHLKDAISKLLPPIRSRKKNRPRLAVFIDDIDRCEPEVAYRLLEGLKIYLTLDNCVFIIGMNQKAIIDAVASRLDYTTTENQNQNINERNNKIHLRATAYMEKLCQNVWQLPTIRNPVTILSEFLKITVKDEDTRNCLATALKNNIFLPPNPRKLKGFANVIGRLTSRIAPEEENASNTVNVREAKLLLIVAYVYHFHINLYIRWEAEPTFYNQILDKCESDKSEIPILASLVMPVKRVSKENEPVPPQDVTSTYPDPTEGDVFWIQSLILELGTEVSPNEFEKYFYGG